MNSLNMHKIYLASRSPRRQQLLKACNIEFELIDIEVDESFPEDMDPREVPEYLAKKKSDEALELINDGIVLTADSVVIVENEILNKPQSKREAYRFIEQLSDNTHEVITGVCLRSKSTIRLFSSLTLVHIKKLDRSEIEYYLEHYQPYDKAGAYGIQEWLGHCKVDWIEGSFNNVMGLPTHLVYEALRHFRD